MAVTTDGKCSMMRSNNFLSLCSCVYVSIRKSKFTKKNCLFFFDSYGAIGYFTNNDVAMENQDGDCQRSRQTQRTKGYISIRLSKHYGAVYSYWLSTLQKRGADDERKKRNDL